MTIFFLIIFVIIPLIGISAFAATSVAKEEKGEKFILLEKIKEIEESFIVRLDFFLLKFSQVFSNLRK